jgi:poly-gamma-glutamate synthesis protein (capsule biosynthesis protein)
VLARPVAIRFAAALLLAAGPPSAARAVPEAPLHWPLLSVSSPLPSWLAPGGRLVVSGLAAPRAEVRLLVNGDSIGKGRAGWRGRFELNARAPKAGTYRVRIASGARRLDLGVLTVRPLVLAAVGDVTFGGPVAQEIDDRGPRYPWLRVASVLSGADLATANLEAVVSTRGTAVSGKPPPRLRGASAALRAAVRFAGLDVLTVANNHTLDFGPEAFLDTMRFVNGFGAVPVGGGSGSQAARRPALLEQGGLRIAFLGYDDTWPGFHAQPGVPGAAAADPAALAEDIRRAGKAADLVVVWFHWGQLFETTPNERQQELAAAAVAAGATVVLGAHPHVLQPIDVERWRLTAWSLGNFVFYDRGPEAAKTGILLVRLDRRGVVGSELRPARIVRAQPRLTGLSQSAVGPAT